MNSIALVYFRKEKDIVDNKAAVVAVLNSLISNSPNMLGGVQLVDTAEGDGEEEEDDDDDEEEEEEVASDFAILFAEGCRSAPVR